MRSLYTNSILTILTLIVSTNLAARIPLIDDQPHASESCPLTNTSHTENSDGSAIGVRQYECTVDNRNVVWTVSIPRDCELGGCGLIVDIHGATMSAAQQNAGTKLREYGWKAMERDAITPYIVAQPNLTDLFDSNLILDFGSVVGGAYSAEIPAMTVFLEDLLIAFNIDGNRTHMYGFSRGAATTSVFYCDNPLMTSFVSFAVGGGGINCAMDKPLLILNGNADPGKMPINDAAVAEIESQGAVSTTVIHDDNDWNKPFLEFSWSGIRTKGRHQHIRYESDTHVLESIRHSGITYPAAGHCHPITEFNSWLNCYTTMDTGAKLIDFFIAHPKN